MLSKIFGPANARDKKTSEKRGYKPVPPDWKRPPMPPMAPRPRHRLQESGPTSRRPNQGDRYSDAVEISEHE